MLTLQRASAGSGKTYTLARTFIRMLISIPDGNGHLRLREVPEVADAASHILGITFTNKATAEMRERIVERLADLAGRTPDSATPYLDDYCREFGCQPSKIRVLARAALESLLNDYSNFQISTIDSFFQNVLRTFAYEVDINDGYQVELDNELLIDTGIDILMRDVADGKSDPETIHWLRELMDRSLASGGKWNMFIADSGTSHKVSVRKSLRTVVAQMDREEFKRRRKEFDEYFAEHPDYSDTVARYRSLYVAPLEKLQREARSKATALRDAFVSRGLDIREAGAAYMHSHADKVAAAASPLELPAFKYEGTVDKISASPAGVLSAKGKKMGLSAADTEVLADAALGFYEAVEAWERALQTPETMLWLLYEPTLSYPALMHRIRENVKEFLQSNNLVELSDTSTLLGRIIGDDETPFIYERLGPRLHHYLIDEFQDTSALQWENLRPLVSESTANAFDNLIIGDAKQSIYRFRNADPSLISTVVPAQFAAMPLRVAGASRAENTNHRSLRRIVEFNNLFFLMAASQLDRADEATGIPAENHSLSELYSNVVQFPRKRDDEGYVEIRFLPKEAAGGGSDDDDSPSEFHYVGPMIDRLLDRGYRQSDIAVLVDTNKDGAEVISALVDHNNRPDATRRIDFISDESLRLESSRAVRIIVSTLEMVAVASLPDEEDTGKPLKDSVSKSELNSLFRHFAESHPELDPEECIREFFSSPDARKPLTDIVEGIHSVTLPALCEAIIDVFVPDSLKEAEAPFIAAFQDALLDYCDSYPADAASFIEWWNLKGARMSLSSPAGIDAVRVMTIHKSKGLEFNCVILPGFNPEFGTTTQRGTKKSYLWLPPLLSVPEHPLPPLLPVEINHALMPASPLAPEYLENLYGETMDRLNFAYVAFTRAVKELYIVSTCPSDRILKEWELPAGARGFREMAWFFFAPDKDAPARHEAEGADAETAESLPGLGQVRFEEDSAEGGWTVIYGSPVAEPAAGRTSDDENTGGPKVVMARSYAPNSRKLNLTYKSRASIGEEDDVDTDTISSDPRKRGNLLHDILSDIAVASDLDMAVRRRVVSGELTPEGAAEAKAMLAEALGREEVREWFDGSMRVINERPFLAGGSEWRPDRMLIDEAGRRAVVVDYKFGSVSDANYKKNHAGYSRQVARYVSMLSQATGYKDVSGYIWYIGRGTVEKVSSESK